MKEIAASRSFDGLVRPGAGHRRRAHHSRAHHIRAHHRHAARAAALALLGALAWTPALADSNAPAPELLGVQQDRSFGYLTGDLFILRALIRIPDGWHVDTRGDTIVGRRAAGFELLDMTTGPADERCSHCVEWRQTWQLLASARASRPRTLAAQTIKLSNDTRSVELPIAKVVLQASPMRDWIGSTDWIKTMQPAPLPVLPDPAPFLWRALWFALAALTSLFAWLALSGRIGGWAARVMHLPPFARAHLHVRRSLRHHAAPESADPMLREALLKFHGAMNSTAGRTVLTEDLPRFLAEHSRFAELEGDIRRCFATSSHLFYGLGSGDLNDAQSVLRILRGLRAAEAR